MIHFDDVIDLEVKEKIPDGRGGNKVTWVLYNEIDAEVFPISGDTFFIAQKYGTGITYKIFIAYDEDILGKELRVKYNNKTLTVKYPIDLGGQQETLMLLCEG